MAVNACKSLYNPFLEQTNEQVDRIIALLLGSSFKGTFTVSIPKRRTKRCLTGKLTTTNHPKTPLAMSNWIVTQIELTGTREVLEEIEKAINQCNDGKGLVGQ